MMCQVVCCVFLCNLTNLYTALCAGFIFSCETALANGAAKSVHVYDSMAGGASQQTRATVRTLAGKRIRICYRSVLSPNCPGCEVSVSPLGVLRKCPEISTELSRH